ncbi:MAG: hypothetical protein AAF348_18055 [Bacteroidota bacterium]
MRLIIEANTILINENPMKIDVKLDWTNSALLRPNPAKEKPIKLNKVRITVKYMSRSGF